MTLPPYPGPDNDPEEQPERDGDQPTSGPGKPPAAEPHPFYGQPTPPPYGAPDQSPYGQPAQPYSPWQGGNDASRGWNGTSIAAFVLGLTCCLGIPAVVCGIIGIRQTGRDGSKGRWMAVTGIVLGVLGTLLVAGLVIGGVFLANLAVTPGNAEAGTCVMLEEDGTDSVAMLEEDCSSAHDGEIYSVVELDDAQAAQDPDPVSVCAGELGVALPGLVDRGFEVYSVTEDSSPEAGDVVVCVLVRADGGTLDGKIDY